MRLKILVLGLLLVGLVGCAKRNCNQYTDPVLVGTITSVSYTSESEYNSANTIVAVGKTVFICRHIRPMTVGQEIFKRTSVCDEVFIYPREGTKMYRVSDSNV